MASTTASTAPAPTSTSAPDAPKLLRLHPLTVNDVPSHPELAAAQTSAPTPAAFITRCMREALAEDFRSNYSVVGTAQESADLGGGSSVSIPVEKLKHRDGAWFGRRSEHSEQQASFEELDALLRVDHARNEMKYTPALFDVNTLVEWDLTDLRIEGVGAVEMRVTQMHHLMPSALLSPRVFTVLLLTLSLTPPPSATLAHSLDLQLPLSLSTFPFGIKARSHCSPSSSSSKLTYKAPTPASPAQRKQDGKKIVDGRYASLEKISKLEKDGKTVTRWEMATESDAGGALPVALQRLGILGAIVKDVPRAIEAVGRERKGGAEA